MELINKLTNEIYYLNLTDGLSISKKDESSKIGYKARIGTEFINDLLFQKYIDNMISKNKHSIRFIIDSQNDENIGLITYRFGYAVASSGYMCREIERIVCDFAILKQEIVLKFDVFASPVIYEDHETSTEDELAEFNKQYTFQIPFSLVPKFFNLNYKQSIYFAKNNVDGYIKKYHMERLKNKYGRVFYVFNDDEDERFLVDASFSDMCRIADGYKKISEYSFNKEDTPEYPNVISYHVVSHLLTSSHMKSILFDSHRSRSEFVQLPLNITYEGKNLGRLFYSYGTDENEENKAERLIEKISYIVDITDIELSIKTEVIASGIDKNKLSRELTAIEKEKHIEKFHIRIPRDFVSEIFNFNQREKYSLSNI